MYKNKNSPAFLILLVSILSGCLKVQENRNAVEMNAPDSFSNHDNNSLQDIPLYEKYLCVNPGQGYEIARVLRVIDGDSIEVKIEDERYEVRYIGINTPEFHSNDQTAAILATEANEILLFGEEVYLFRDVSNTDRYGRLLRYVFTDNEFINLAMVSQGLAESRAYPPDTACQALFEQADSAN
jgi:endonuclease YncB( thermonuclease family)